MVESPFSAAGQGYSRLSTALSDRAELFGADVAHVGQTQQGQTATALMDLLNDHRHECEVLSQHATSMVSACVIQTDVDHGLINAPSPAEVDEAKEKYHRAMETGELTRFIPARERYNELSRERDAAYVEHMHGTEGTNPKIVPPAESESSIGRGRGGRKYGGSDDTGGDGVQLMPLNRAAGSPFVSGNSGGMPIMPPMSADQISTKLSGDTESAAAARGMATPTQPALPPMQPQGGAPAGGAPMGGTPMPGMAMPGAAMPKPRKDKDKSDPAFDATMLSADTAAAGSAVAAAPVDRGGSLHGVTTKADVSGRAAPVVGVRAPVPPMGGSGPMGGPMGGMPMGGGAGLHGGNSTTGKRPEVFAHDKKLQGDEAVENAVQNGLIGRKSANPPKPGDKETDG